MALQALEASGFDLSLRAEDLTIEQFCTLANQMVKEGVLEPGKIHVEKVKARSYEKV